MESNIVGRWQNGTSGGFGKLEFFSDGTYTSYLNNYSGTYSIDGDRIKFTGVLVSDKTYTFDLDGDTLTLYSDSDRSRGTEYDRVDEWRR